MIRVCKLKLLLFNDELIIIWVYYLLVWLYFYVLLLNWI